MDAAHTIPHTIHKRAAHAARLRRILGALTAPLAIAALLVPAAASASVARCASHSARCIPNGPSPTEAPYFHIPGSEDGTESLPLKDTRAAVDVSGSIAHVHVTQVYENTGKKPIEAVYVFPGGTRSAVFGMHMTVGERRIKANIQEKEQARKLYEAAKAEGKSASLLEQHRPNVFQMNVANILPGDVITVELDYTELLVPENGVYEFVYPTVVGPRFSEAKKGTAAAKDEAFVSNPYVARGSGESSTGGSNQPYTWDLTAHLSAPMGIEGVNSPSHKVHPHFKSKSELDVVVDESTRHGDRDFVLRYRLTGGAIQTGMLLYPGTGEGGDDENFFLLMVQPPKRVAKKAMPAREYVFVLDVSGSMSGFPLNTAKRVMQGLLSDLRPQDRFNILFFSGQSALLSPKSLPATGQNIQAAMAATRQQRGGGGTRLTSALERALKLPTNSENTSRTFVVVTDGYISVEAKTFETIRDNLGEANVFTFGIGSSVNRHLIDGMAHVGGGEPFVVLNGDQADTQVKRFKQLLATPALTNVELAYKGFDAYDVTPRAVPDVFADRPVIVMGKYRGKPSGHVVVSGTTGNGRFMQTLSARDARADKKHMALKYLWARDRVRELGDFYNLTHDDARKTEITELGLRYSLMTKFTSFIAIDERVRNTSGESSTVKQPLPMPHGVSNNAVGTGQLAGRGYAQPSGGLGLMGSGYGGGGMRMKRKSGYARPRAPMAKPAPSPAEDLAEAEAPTKAEARLEGAADKDATTAERKAEKQRGPAVRIRVTGATGPHNKAALHRALRAVRAKFARAMNGVAARGQNVQVELAVDASGKIRVVRVTVDGRAVRARALKNAFERVRIGQASGKSTFVVSLKR